MSAPSSTIPQTLWAAQIPLHITHRSAPTTPFITSVPRFSYLSLLLPRLSAFFDAPCSSFHFEDVQLRNLAADFVRYGNANQIMKMSKEHTTQLWNSVIDNDFAAFSKIHTRLLNAPATLKHVPIRIYIPSTPPNAGGDGSPSAPAAGEAGSFRIVQSLVPVVTPDRKPKLLGQALKDLMPTLFPSSRDPVLAGVVLHGVSAPFNAPLGEMMREAAYPDGWLCFVVVV
ncbi:autophagy 5 [Trichoderma arundinaceum]|uniref:Autophagy protein 5 n=1 Tax=Trichoderma arundinaceum TaxID=490622 RepID=A0A395NXT5_TRIAR|nr:autophagy 5 [Trichoderma arundinaceum]